MDAHPLGQSGLSVTPIGYGAFKIGRNEQIKYPAGYALPSDEDVQSLIHGLRALGVNFFDTAPAYGTSEERLGKALAGIDDVVISTKVGETFTNGRSQFDFTAPAVRNSLERSRERLGRDSLDLVYVHSDGNDRAVINNTDVIATLRQCKAAGEIRAIGFSGKTTAGALAALDWADVIMVQYHRDDDSHDAVIQEAHSRGVGVVVKKGLGSGHIPPREALQFVLGNPQVDSVVVGSLNIDHLRENVDVAEAVRSGR